MGRKTLQLGVCDAVITFNEGQAGRLKVLEEVGIEDVGINCVEALQRLDAERISRAEFALKSETREARKKRKRGNLVQDEDNQYEPGGF